MKNKLNLSLLIIIASIGSCINGDTNINNSINNSYSIKKNIFYKLGKELSEYEKSRCYLDLYLPDTIENFPVLIWFHGGSIERLNKDEKYTQIIGSHFANKGIGVVTVNYRLSPETKFPGYIKDAAASVAWVKKNISQYSGDSNLVFLGGHSAGAYISSMLVMDKQYLDYFGIDIKEIKGLLLLGSQTITHYTVRKEQGIKDYENTPLIDKAAPAFYAMPNIPPVIAICGDGDTYSRKVENLYFVQLLRKMGNDDVKYIEVQNHNHWDLVKNIQKKDNNVSELIYSFILNHID